MEFTGRIMKVLPQRSGVSKKTGNEWKSQPFVFEYFENQADRWSDKVLLETFDQMLIPYIKEGVAVRCGFGHSVREFDGKTYNEVRLYRLEILGASNNQQPQEQQAQQPTTSKPPVPPITQQQDHTAQLPGEGKSDDLPF